MSMLQETHNQYATFDNDVKCGSLNVEGLLTVTDLVVTNGADIGGLAVITTDQNTVVGTGAASGGVTNVQNVSVGSAAGAALASNGNVVVGYGAVTTGVCSGTNEVVIGANAAPVLTTGSRNVVVGSDAGALLTAGDDNVIIGNAAASASGILGSANVIIGSGADLGGDYTGCVAIGAGTIGPFTAPLQLGLSALTLAAGATAGAGGALPATVAGYLPIFIGAVQYMIPLFLP